MDYTVFSSILLTSVAVIVTAMSVIMAFLAFIGYRNILDQASASAASGAKEQITTSLGDGGELRTFIEERVDSIARDKLLKTHIPADPEVTENKDRDKEFKWEDKHEGLE